jgi:hypothetical protein
VINQVNGVVLEPYRAQLAREAGLDKDPETVARIQGKLEQLLVERMYQDSVGSKTWVSREDRLTYYNEHKKDFFTFPAVDYAAIFRYTKSGADSLMLALKGGAKPQDIITADSLRGEVTGGTHHMMEAEHSPYHKVLFEELRPGQMTMVGPDRTGVYMVLQLINYDPGHQLTFEESQSIADESMQNIKSEQALNAMIDRLSKRFDIASRPELVMKIRFVDRTER